jgi:hypothetical protein
MRTSISLVIAMSVGVLLVAAVRPAVADTAYLALAGANPYNGPCPATLNFNGHIDGAAGSSVTYTLAHFVAGHWIYSAATTAAIPAGGSLPVNPSLMLDATQQGFQSYEISISAPAGSDSATHGKVYFTVNCVALQVIVPPRALRPVTLIPLHAGMAYFQDHTGFNPFCIPWPLPHPGLTRTDFGGSVAVGYTHYQHGGPNGDPCGVHDDHIYRIMLDGDVPPISGHLGSVVVTATRTAIDTNAVTQCKLGSMSFVRGAFNVGDVHDASNFSQATGLSWFTSGPDTNAVDFQIYPSNEGSFLDAPLNAALAQQVASGFHIQLMLVGPNEHIDRDNLRCLLQYTNFALNIIAG